MPRSILVNPFSRTGSARRRPRRRVAPLAAAALATLTLAGPIATPAHAVVDRDSYMACVNAVAEWTDRCRDSHTGLGDVGCVIAGTLGILGCAVLEVIEKLGGGVSLE